MASSLLALSFAHFRPPPISLFALVEYYFELCGAYSLGTGSSTSYNERFALTSTERLKQFFNSITRCDGLALARKAIQCVRDGCRSPMETAFVMMLTLPKKRRRAWY